MIINLCGVDDGDNVINKSLNNITPVTIKPRKDFDIINPVLLIENTSTLDVLSFNYVDIPELNRKYFIDSVENFSSKIYKLNCSCDVLESFKNEVLNSNASYTRSLRTGDYENITIDTSTKKVITIFNSDVDIAEQSSMIMSTIGEL